MGGAISSLPAVETVRNIKDVHLKQLPDAIEEAIFIHEKFPLIIDPTEQAARLSRFAASQCIESSPFFYFYFYFYSVSATADKISTIYY